MILLDELLSTCSTVVVENVVQVACVLGGAEYMTDALALSML